MKKSWLAVLATVLILAGCTPDRTLETLIPRNSLAVVLVDHPSMAAQVLGPGGAGIPWRALETGKPWAAAVVPANPPGFLLALALADQPAAWTDLERWARESGGMSAVHLGSYAVLSSPGLAEPAALDPDRRFDLGRVRAGGDPVAVYLDVKNIMDEADFPDALKPLFPALPWAEKNLAGIRLGFLPKDGGLELRVATDGKPEALGALKGWSVPADPAAWAGLLPVGDGFGAVFSLPAPAWKALGGSLGDPSLVGRWDALAPLLGPRVALALVPKADGPWGWSVAVESRDSQAVRQALKTLVASGDVQRSFPRWAIDADTPLIYQDAPGAGGVVTTLTFGANRFQAAYGDDRVVFAAGADSGATLVRWRRAGEAPAEWTRQAPSGALGLATGSSDGLAAKAAFRVLGDGNVEARFWVDAAGLKTWEERLPQAARGWLSGPGGWTRAEP